MSGRRFHPRFVVSTACDGAVRVLRDVVVQRTGPDELLAVSLSPGVIDEEMSLDVVCGESSLRLRVKVVESAPIIVHDAVRYRIRLSVVHSDPPTTDEPMPPGADR
jgi:hypothetical protein